MELVNEIADRDIETKFMAVNMQLYLIILNMQKYLQA